MSRITGPLGRASGIGDLTILWVQNLADESEHRFDVQVGAKLATGSANSGGLPQAYQPGLGTNDLLIGASYRRDEWTYSAGYQFSRGRSDNAITGLRRGDDILGRVAYAPHFQGGDGTVELLMIKRLHLSSVRVPAGAFIDVADSDQLQTNVAATLAVPLNDECSLQFFGALPLLNRSVNVDGLTRSLTLSMELQFSP